MLTATGTALSTTINFFNQQDYAHISIAMDEQLLEVYSFGRLKHSNPFIGGFTTEDVTSDFYKNANCQIYALDITQQQFDKLGLVIQEFKKQKESYQYNLLGLFTCYINIPWERPNAYFCSEFVSTALMEANILDRIQPASITQPQFILANLAPQLKFEGRLYEYQNLPAAPGHFEKMIQSFLVL